MDGQEREREREERHGCGCGRLDGDTWADGDLVVGEELDELLRLMSIECQ